MSSQAAAKLLRKAWGQGLNGLKADGLPGVAISATQATAADTSTGFGAAGFSTASWGAPSLNGGAAQWGGWSSSSTGHLGASPLPFGLPALPIAAQEQQRMQQQQQQQAMPLAARGLTAGIAGLPVHGFMGLGAGSRVIDGEQLLPMPALPLPMMPFGAAKDAASTRELLASLFDPAAAAGEGAALEATRANAAQQPAQQQRTIAPVVGAGAAGKRTRGSSSSVALNKEIMAASTVEELLHLVRNKSAHFDFFNISSAVSRAPKLVEQAHYHGHGSAVAAAAESEAAMEAMRPSVDGASGAAVQQHVGHLSPAAQELADRLCALAMENMRAFDARGLANTAWAFGKLRYVPDPALPALLCTHATAKINDFAAQNLANLAWAMVYMHHRDDALLALLSQRIRTLVSDLKPQELANVMWAFASLEHFDPATANVLSARAARLAPLFKEQELSNIIWALGRAHAYDPRLMSVLLNEARAKLHHFLPQGVSNVVWALGQLGHYDEQLLRSISVQFGPTLHSFDVQALSNLAWGMAALGYRDEALMGAVAREAAARVGRMSPQNMASMLWACASLGVRNDTLVSSITQEALERLPSFEPQGLWQLAWGAARLGHHDPCLFDGLATAAKAKVDRFNSQGLANITWAFAAVGHQSPELYEALAQRVARVAPAFNGPNCSAAAWAFAHARHASSEAMDALLRRIMALQAAQSCEPQHLAVTVTAAAKLGHNVGPLSSHLAASTLAVAHQMSAPDLCSSLWALSAMDMLDPNTFALLSGLVEKHTMMGAPLSAESLEQAFSSALLLQASLARHLGVPLAALELDVLPHLPASLNDAALAAWAQAARNVVHVPIAQHGVAATLAAAGVPHAAHWLTDDGLLSADVALQVDGRSVALELCGPEDLCTESADGRQRLTGEALVRFRLLQARGWDVVGVTAAQWAGLADLPVPEAAAALLQHVTAQVGPLQWSTATAPVRGAATLAAMGLDADAAALLLSMQQVPTPAGSSTASNAQLPADGSNDGVALTAGALSSSTSPRAATSSRSGSRSPKASPASRGTSLAGNMVSSTFGVLSAQLHAAGDSAELAMGTWLPRDLLTEVGEESTAGAWYVGGAASGGHGSLSPVDSLGLPHTLL